MENQIPTVIPEKAPEVITSVVKPKKSLDPKTKKILIIVAAILGAILLLAILVPVLILGNKSVGTDDNSTTETTTPPVTTSVVETTTTTSTVVQTSTPVLVEKVVKSYQIVSTDNKASNLIVEYSGTPETSSPVTITKGKGAHPVFESGVDDSTYIINEANTYSHFKIGTVKEGTFAKYNVFIAFAKPADSQPVSAKPYSTFQNSWLSFNYMYYIYLSDSKSNVLLREKEDSLNVSDLATNTKSYISSELYDSFVNYKTINDVIVTNQMTALTNAYNVTKLRKGFTTQDGVEVFYDPIQGQSMLFVKNPSGFYMALFYTPYFTKNKLNWVDGTTSNGTPYSIIAGRCSLGYTMRIADVKASDLVVASKSDPNYTLYEYADLNKDPLIKTMYDEDYVQTENYKYNTIKEDDAKPLTFAQYLKYHPVVYWKDQIGRYVTMISTDFVMEGGCGKPVINLYPTAKTNVSVKLTIDGNLTVSDPKYTQDGWNVVANPDGTLIQNDQKYKYLFWEGQFRKDISRTDAGWYVEKQNVESFLNSKLQSIGFNNAEKQEFIEYWLPKINKENNKYIFISFVDEKALDVVAPIQISPKPDTYRRLFMWYRGENSKREIKDLSIPSFERKGFTLFEWGGAKITKD